MLYVLAGAIIIVIIVVPELWVKGVMKYHDDEIPGMPGTGGELARHLLDEAGLHEVKVERGKAWGDHYSPDEKAVRLSPGNFDGKSLTAVAVSAHEVGHALQDRDNDSWLERRQRMIPVARTIQRIGMAMMYTAPIVGLLARSPALAAVFGAGGLIALLSRVAVHLVTLPVELDASFNRALPMIMNGRYVAPGEVPAVRRVLRAAALTYVAAAAMDVINIARWVLITRGRGF